MTDLERVVSTLVGFTSAVLGDVLFRRRLRYSPRAALADYGLPSDAAPARLPVRHYTISATIDHAHVWGVGGPGEATDVPLDLRLVAYGAKPMALALGPEQSLQHLASWARARGLTALFSPYALEVEADTGKGGYANLIRGTRPARVGSGELRHLVVAADDGQAMSGWLSLLFSWDDYLGALLGYPPCCRAKYLERWPIAARDHEGDVAALLSDVALAGPYDWRLNVLGRYFGAELIQHFPCSWDCQASLAVAARHERALSTFEPATLARVRDALAVPMVYAQRAGVYALRGATLATPGRVSYVAADVVAADRSASLFSSLGDATEIVCADGALRVGEREVRGFVVDFREVRA